MATEQPIIKVDNLKVIYNKGKPNEVRSLDNISAKIYPHEYVIIFGPSGCGKSTLLYSMSGLQAASGGEVTFNGKNVAKMTKKERVEMHQVGIGMIFQAFYLIPSLTILDNVCLPKVFRGEGVSRRTEDGVKLLQRFSIVEQKDKFPSQLSGGQKQRVSIARSLVNNPGVIFADEPVGNLDSVSSENVMQILKELNEVDKKTIVLVTHNAEHLHYADRVIYIKDGKLLKEEVNKEKRPAKAVGETESEAVGGFKYEEMSNELKLLMRTFKNLSINQVGSLLVPFKADQLMSHIMSNLSQEQVKTGEAYLKEFLFNNIDLYTFKKNLDLDYEKGGAGWNKQRVKNFVTRLENIIRVSQDIAKNDAKDKVESLFEYLTGLFKLELNTEMSDRFKSFLDSRLKNEFDRAELKKHLDAPRGRGGMGFYSNTAEKISSEVEIVMLVKYST